MSIQQWDRIQVVKGCRDLNILKGYTARVLDVIKLGPEYSHFVKVVLQFDNGSRVGLYARHINRLSDPTCNLNSGNPFQKITITKV